MAHQVSNAAVLDNVTRRSIGFAALGVGLLMLFLAVPRIVSAVISSSAPTVIFDLSQNHPIEEDRLLAVEEDVRKALSLDVDTGTLYGQLSLLMMHRLNNDTLEERGRKAELQESLKAVEAALKRRPADAYLWTRYAHNQYLLTGLGPYTLSALERSYVFGHREPELIRFRMRLSLFHWNEIPKSLQDRALNQLTIGASNPKIWGRFWGDFLATLSTPLGERLLGLMKSVSMDWHRASVVANDIRARKDGIDPLNEGAN